MTLVFDFVPFPVVYEEIRALNESHADDAQDEAEGPVNADWDYYLFAGSQARCWAATVRDDGKMVAYSVFFIDNNFNHKHLIEATSAGFFVDRAYRGKNVFNDLRAYSEEYLQKIGANVVQYILRGNGLGRVLSSKGYSSDYRVWSKTL